MQGNLAIVELLIKKGAEINKQSFLAWTALHYAVHLEQELVAEILLKNGALEPPRAWGPPGSKKKNELNHIFGLR